MTRKAADNSRFAKAGVWYFYDSEVLNSSFVHLMKFCAENPRLRKAAKRYSACLTHVRSVYVRARIRVRDSSEKPAAGVSL
jgi:hypothetical protein